MIPEWGRKPLPHLMGARLVMAGAYLRPKRWAHLAVVAVLREEGGPTQFGGFKKSWFDVFRIGADDGDWQQLQGWDRLAWDEVMDMFVDEGAHGWQ